jgi:signal peptidase I
MTVQVRLLRWACAVAAALVIAAWTAPRFGIVFVGGWSMSPALVPGDLVVYRNAGRAVERDIVLVAARGAAPFLHRVVAVRLDGRLRTQGDANGSPDTEPVAPEDVVGVGVVAVPGGRALHAVVAGIRWCYNHVPIADTRR